METNELPETIETMNAEIVGTLLGFNDRGIMDFRIEMKAWTKDGSETNQHIGGFVLSNGKRNSNNKEKHKEGVREVKHNWFCDFLYDLLKTIEVDTWEKLRGKLVRVKASTMLGRKIKVYKIGHITKNQWLILDWDKIIKKPAYREEKVNPL